MQKHAWLHREEVMEPGIDLGGPDSMPCALPSLPPTPLPAPPSAPAPGGTNQGRLASQFWVPSCLPSPKAPGPQALPQREADP